MLKKSTIFFFSLLTYLTLCFSAHADIIIPAGMHVLHKNWADDHANGLYITLQDGSRFKVNPSYQQIVRGWQEKNNPVDPALLLIIDTRSESWFNWANSKGTYKIISSDGSWGSKVVYAEYESIVPNEHTYHINVIDSYNGIIGIINPQQMSAGLTPMFWQVHPNDRHHIFSWQEGETVLIIKNQIDGDDYRLVSFENSAAVSSIRVTLR